MPSAAVVVAVGVAATALFRFYLVRCLLPSGGPALYECVCVCMNVPVCVCELRKSKKRQFNSVLSPCDVYNFSISVFVCVLFSVLFSSSLVSLYLSVFVLLLLLLDWTSTLTPPTPAVAVAAKKVAVAGSASSSTARSTSSVAVGVGSVGRSSQNSIKHKAQQSIGGSGSSLSSHSHNKKTKSSISHPINSSPYSSAYSCDEEELAASLRSDVDAAQVERLSSALLDKLREAKARHLTCTEVSLPCDLTPSIAAEIIRVSEKEPCGIRGCTIYVEFEDEPQNSRRIASLKVDPETEPTFEVYLTLRQDHRGWTALLPQFMKSLARTITISPEYTITKHKLYSTDGIGARRSYSFGSTSSSSSSHSQAIATPSI